MPGSQFYDWPDWATEPTPEQLQKVYEDGFPGAPEDPGNVDQLFSDGLVQTFSAAAGHLRDLHKQNDRKVVPLFLSREKLDPGATKVAQKTGDCVSFGDWNARDVVQTVEIAIHKQPEKFLRSATEATYGHRGHRGAGMDPARATRFVTEVGFLYRKNYPDLGIDLTEYNVRVGMNWGGRGVPEAVKEECRKHAIGRYIVPETLEEALDLFAAGYACHSGQNVGFRSSPNSQGYHPISSRWNHDMATVGYDISKDVWPVEVVFVQNSWGDAHTQPEQQFRDRNWPRIPGMLTARADDWWKRFGTCYFYSDVGGIPIAKDLIDWGDIGL